MAHKRTISWLQIQNRLPTVEGKTKCPTEHPLPRPQPLPPARSLACRNMCKQNGAQETNLWRTSANSQTFYFISFHLISFALALSPSLTHTLMPRCSFWVWKLKWNTTEMLQKSTNWHQLLLQTRPGAGQGGPKLSNKVCGKWAFPARKKYIRVLRGSSAFSWSITRPTLIASLARPEVAHAAAAPVSPVVVLCFMQI